MTAKLDRSVVLTMGIATLLALIAIGFKAATYENCATYHLNISYSQSQIREAGKPLTFTVEAKNDEVWWDFGDGSEIKQGRKVQHTYFQSGTFTVVAKFKGNCRLFENVFIAQPQSPSQQEMNNFGGPIYGNHEVPAGSALQLTSTKTANSYLWRVKEHPEIPKQFERNVSFVFNMPGVYVVELLLDSNEQNIATHEVLVGAPEVSDVLSSPVIAETMPITAPGPAPTVIPVKEEEEEEQGEDIPAKRFLTITDAEMKLLLGELATGKKAVGEFNSYLCNGVNTKVVANGKATVFAELQSALQDKKGIMGLGGKRKIQKVKQTFDPANGNCVLVLTVDYK